MCLPLTLLQCVSVPPVWGLLRCIGWHRCYHIKPLTVPPILMVILLWDFQKRTSKWCVAHSSHIALRGRLCNPQRREQKGFNMHLLDLGSVICAVQTWVYSGKIESFCFYFSLTPQTQKIIDFSTLPKASDNRARSCKSTTKTRVPKPSPHCLENMWIIIINSNMHSSLYME